MRILSLFSRALSLRRSFDCSERFVSTRAFYNVTAHLEGRAPRDLPSSSQTSSLKKSTLLVNIQSRPIHERLQSNRTLGNWNSSLGIWAGRRPSLPRGSPFFVGILLTLGKVGVDTILHDPMVRYSTFGRVAADVMPITPYHGT